jgi:thioredoxin 1
VKQVPTLVVRDRIAIASQPGTLSELGLEEVDTGVKELDMDEVRREMADSETRETG